MRISFLVAVTALMTLASTTNGQRPANVTICDYYTNATFGNANATNEYLLLKILVNTVVIGNYTATPTNQIVPGILANATVNGEVVSLLSYFDGSRNSSNVNGAPAAVNYLNAGGAAPLMMNLPSNDSMTCTSNQCMLLTHLYELFGKLLGCSQYNSSAFTPYAGDPNMYSVHKFMYLNNAQNTYFIQQVGAAASANGVTMADVTVVATSLTSIFNRQCSKPIALDTGAPVAPQSICNVPGCMLASPAYCAAYNVGPTGAPATAPGMAPIVAPPAATTPTLSATSPTPSASSASTLRVSLLVLVAGVVLSILA